MNILLTGSGGYIGSYLAKVLADDGHIVTCLDNFYYNQYYLINTVLRHPNISCYKKDCVNIPSQYIVDQDLIIPLSALVGMPICRDNPIKSQMINVDQISNILDKVHPKQRILGVNSTSSYGNSDGLIDEDSPRNGISLYAQQKDENEKLIKERHNNRVILRLATVMGVSPRMRLDLLVNNWVYRAMFENRLEVFDGHFKRNMVHVQDVVGAIRFCINNWNKVKNQEFNIGNQNLNTTKWDLAKKIGDYFKIPVTQGQGVDIDQRNCEINASRFVHKGFEYIRGLESTIAELQHFYSYLPDNKTEREKIIKDWKNY